MNGYNKIRREKDAIKGAWIFISLFLSGMNGFGQVTADFEYTFISGLECAESAIEFTNLSSTSSGNVELTLWDFGDGEGSTVLSPVHAYTEAGTYTVTLTVQNTSGDFDSHQEMIVVNPLPQVNFAIAGSTPDQCESIAQVFNNLSTISGGSPMTYSWDFDGLANSTDEDPSFTFPGPGSYNVTLTATADGTGCSASTSQLVIIHPEAVVDFSFSDQCNGTPVTFTNHSQVSSGNMTFQWVFGDGNNSTEENPLHSYAGAGDYTVGLTVTTEEGCETSLQQMVTISDQPTADFTFSNECFGLPVNFTNTSLLADSYSWEFGDGTSSTQTNPSHTYSAPGTYEVSLTSSSAEGCSDVTTRFVTIHPVPVAAFDLADVCLGNAAAFANTSEIASGDLSYDWDFGDTGISTGTDPTHTYTSPGTLTVTLTASSAFGCEDVATADLEVFASTVAGSVNGSAALCIDDNTSNTLTLTGQTGDVVRWERSATGVDQWVTIENTGTILEYSDLEETTYFQAIVQNGACAQQISSIAAVQIDALSDGGSLDGSTSVCADANAGSITLSGHSGDVVQWIRSTDSENGPWTPIANISTTQNYSALTQTTHYRAIVNNGVCANDSSQAATITVFPATVAGLLTGSATVCTGTNSGVLNLTGNTGDVIRWESSPTSNGPWATINNETTGLNYSNLLNTTYYHAVMKSGVCEPLNSNAVVITVDEATVAGEITGTSEVCDQINTGTLSLNTYTGDVIRWQSSPDAVSWQDIINTTATQGFSDLDETTYYRAEVQNGVCNPAFTPVFEVTVHPLPEISFTSDKVCEGAATSFTNTSSLSSGAISSYFWDFSTGTTSTHRDPVYTFPGGGTYSVELKVTSIGGCVDSATSQVIVHPEPDASFSQADVCEGETMAFTDLSGVATGSVEVYEWDFGDGNTSIEESPAHLFEEPGVYTVSLSISTDQGCENEVQQEVIMHPDPVTDFSFENKCDGEPVTFQNNSTIISGNLTYAWNFGDGSSSTAANPTYSYAGDGLYNTLLTATSQYGCETSQIKPVTIYEQPVAGFIVEDICADTEMVFENITSGTDVDYAWDFGDDSFSDEADPIHFYKTSGTYQVSLSVSSDDGCTDAFQKRVKVHPLPTISFVFEDVCDTVTVPFSNLSSIPSGNISYKWDFGDGESSVQSAPAHRYAAFGNYQVGLTGTSDFGCVSHQEKALSVFARPQAGFETEAVCDGKVTYFQNTSTIAAGFINSFIWDFGDGTNSIVEHPAKQYLNKDIYEVSLEVSSDKGCESRFTREAIVDEIPIADFEVENVCIGFPIRLENRSFMNSGSLTYTWDFGDGNMSTQTDPDHTYVDPGVYTITLTARASTGCTDIVLKDVAIYDRPEVNAGKDTLISQGYSVRLSASGGMNYSWSPVDGLDNSSIPDPVATPMQTTDYVVRVFDQYGCENTDTVTVQVQEDFRLVANNVFTPDGNGINDTWIIENVETFGTVNVRVYDRYGTLVFQDEAYQNNWTGTYGNDILPDGTYYYLITFSDSPTKYNGALTIMRNR